MPSASSGGPGFGPGWGLAVLAADDLDLARLAEAPTEMDQAVVPGPILCANNAAPSGGARTTTSQLGQSFVEQLLKFRDAAPFQQHVPVRAW
jgi:hypothetical protein